MSATSQSRSSVKKADTEERSASNDDVLPVVGVHVPSVVVDVAFWGGLAGAVYAGLGALAATHVIPPPVALTIGVGHFLLDLTHRPGLQALGTALEEA